MQHGAGQISQEMDSMRAKRFLWTGFALPSLQDVVFISLFLGVVGIGPSMLNVDGDLGRHLTIGNYILTNHTIPTADIFSHTMAGQPLTPHEWLAELFLALAYRTGGLNGVVMLSALLIALTFTLVFQQCLRRSGYASISLGLTVLAAMAASLHWLARPHLFTLLLVVLWTGNLEGLRRGEGFHWWVAPLLMVFWANLHGAFIAGFVLWGIYLLGELWDGRLLQPGWLHKLRKPLSQGPGPSGNQVDQSDSSQPETKSFLKDYLVMGVLSFGVTLLNPAGLDLWRTSLGFLGNRYLVSHTVEYLPPNFQEPSTWPFLVLIVLSLLVVGRAGRGLKGAHLLLLGAWTAMGLVSARNIPLYSVLAAPVLGEAAAEGLNRARGFSGLKNLEKRIAIIQTGLYGVAWPVLVVLGVGLAFSQGVRLDFNQEGNRFSPQIFPVQAVDWLESHPQDGRAFNYFPWGGYLLYRLWPEQKVFIDGQTDFYGEALTRQYEQVITLSPGWEGVLEAYRVDWVIMPAGSELVGALLEAPGWEMQYQGTTAAILSRNP